MINRHHQLPITRQSQLLGLSRDSVYYLPRPVSDADQALMRRIDELHLAHPFMGARMLRDQLDREGRHVGPRHSRTLMQRMGIEALAPQLGTSKRVPGYRIYPCLLRKLSVVRANQGWALDTTYIPMARGSVYLTAVVDVASRRVLAQKVTIALETRRAREIIEEAFARYGTPEILKTDQGSQFTATEFTDAVLGRGCKLSMDGRGAWRDRRLCRTRLTQCEVRARVPQGSRQRKCGTRRHRRLFELVQHGKVAFQSEPHHVQAGQS
jgi:putative transposase